MDRGYLTLIRRPGWQVRIHVLLVLGLTVGLAVYPRSSFWLAVAGLHLMHQCGHLWMLRRFDLGIRRLDFDLLGGRSAWHHPATSLQRALVAWGGPASHMFFLAITGLFFWWLPQKSIQNHAWLFQDLWRCNLLMLLWNLIPFRISDGSEVWRIFSAIRHHYAAFRTEQILHIQSTPFPIDHSLEFPSQGRNTRSAHDEDALLAQLQEQALEEQVSAQVQGLLNRISQDVHNQQPPTRKSNPETPPE